MEKAVQQFVQRPPGVGKAVQQFVQRPPGVGKVVQQFVQRPPCYMYSGSMKYPPTHAWGRRCTDRLHELLVHRVACANRGVRTHFLRA